MIFSQALGKSEKPITVCVHSIHRSPEERCFTEASQLLPPGKKQLLLLIPAPGKLNKLILHLLYSQRAAIPFYSYFMYQHLINPQHSSYPNPSSPTKINISLSSSQLLQIIIAEWFSPAFSKHLKVLWLWEKPWLWERLRFLTELSLFSDASFLKHAPNHKAQPSTQLQQLFFASLHVTVKDPGKSSLFKSLLYSHELPKSNESELNVLIVLSQMRNTLHAFNRTRPQTWQLFKQVSDVPHDSISKYYLSFGMLSG